MSTADEAHRIAVEAVKNAILSGAVLRFEADRRNDNKPYPLVEFNSQELPLSTGVRAPVLLSIAILEDAGKQAAIARAISQLREVTKVVARSTRREATLVVYCFDESDDLEQLQYLEPLQIEVTLTYFNMQGFQERRPFAMIFKETVRFLLSDGYPLGQIRRPDRIVYLEVVPASRTARGDLPIRDD